MPCSQGSDACNGIAVCVDTIIDQVTSVRDFFVGVLRTGFDYAAEQMAEHVVSQIPGLAALASIWHRLEELLLYDGVDLLAPAALGLRLPYFGLGLGSLPTFQLPSLTVNLLGALLLLVGLVVVLLAAHRAGALEPLLSNSFRAAVLTVVLSTLAFVAGTLLLLYEIHDQMCSLYEYCATVQFSSAAKWYALAVFLLLLDAFLILGRVTEYEVAVYQEERKKRLQEEKEEEEKKPKGTGGRVSHFRVTPQPWPLPRRLSPSPHTSRR